MAETKIKTIDLILEEVRFHRSITVPELTEVMAQKHHISLELCNVRGHLSRLEEQKKIRSELVNLPPRLHQQGSPRRRFYYSVD
jgi:hypothetical protein